MCRQLFEESHEKPIKYARYPLRPRKTLRTLLNYCKQVEADHTRLERERDEFFSDISHVLRTPLAAITASIGVVPANWPSASQCALPLGYATLASTRDTGGQLSLWGGSHAQEDCQRSGANDFG